MAGKRIDTDTQALYKQLANSPVNIEGREYESAHAAVFERQAAFKDPERQKKFRDSAYAALESDARNAALLAEAERLGKENGATPEAMAELREKYKGGAFADVLAGRTSVARPETPAQPADQTSAPGQGESLVSSITGRVKDAVETAGDLVETLASGYTDSVTLSDKDLAGMANLVRPKGTDADVMVNGRIIDSKGNARDATEQDKADIRSVNDAVNYDPDRGYHQAAKGGETSGSETPVSETPVSETAPAPQGGPRIVINPAVFKDKRDALCVAFNERFRIYMEQNDFIPQSEPTDEQREFFSDTAYADDEVQLRRTILARIATLDTSVKSPTDEQLEETVAMLQGFQQTETPTSTWEEGVIERLVRLVEQVAVRGRPIEPSREP